MPRITATEASRNFSDLLNRVAAGEEIEIVRAGATVAVIGPPARRITADRFHELVAAAPPVDDAFAGEVMAARRVLGTPDDPWPS